MEETDQKKKKKKKTLIYWVIERKRARAEGKGWLRRTRLPFFYWASGKPPRTRGAGNGRE